jgi:hypothetical protein
MAVMEKEKAVAVQAEILNSSKTTPFEWLFA